MTLIQAINTHISNQYLIAGNRLPQEALCREVEILGNSQILCFDNNSFKNNVLNNIFNDGDCRKFCDYIIVSNEVVLICEMKSNNLGQANKQLLNGKFFYNFFFEILNKHCNILHQPPPIKFITFSNKGIRPTTKAKSKITDFCNWNGHDKYHLKCGTSYHIFQLI
jgi:hypothetical protein